MRIGNKIFPYPVYNNSQNMSSYNNSTFSLEYEESENDNKFILKNIKIQTNSLELKEYIEKGKAKACVVIDCSLTVYKEIFEIGLIERDIEIEKSMLNGNVEVSSFVYVTEDITGFTSKDLLDEYNGFKFSIDKNCIIAIDDGYSHKIEYDDYEDKKVASIFSIVKNCDEDDKKMKVYAEEKKIKVTLPENEFNNYDTIKGNEEFNNIFFSIIIIPALTIVLCDLKNDVDKNDKELEEIRFQYSWFESIKNAYKKVYKTELTKELFLQSDPFELSQELINNCSTSSIKDFYNIVTRIEEGKENE